MDYTCVLLCSSTENYRVVVSPQQSTHDFITKQQSNPSTAERREEEEHAQRDGGEREREQCSWEKVHLGKSDYATQECPGQTQQPLTLHLNQPQQNKNRLKHVLLKTDRILQGTGQRSRAVQTSLISPDQFTTTMSELCTQTQQVRLGLKSVPPEVCVSPCYTRKRTYSLST